MKRLLSLVLTLALALSMAAVSRAEEPVQLRWILYTTDYAPKDLDMVAQKLNEMSAQDIGVTVKFEYVTRDQVSLIVNSGEYFDLCYTSSTFNDFATNAANGIFCDITDSVRSQTPALFDSIPGMLWDATAVGGRNYAVPILKDYAVEVFWRLDPAAFVDELGMTVPETMTFADIEPYLAAYKAAHPDDYPMYCKRNGPDSNENQVNWIMKDIMLCTEFVDADDPEAYKVKLALEVDDVTERYRLMHRWYGLGYINPDAATTNSIPNTQYSPVRSGQGWFGAESIWEGQVSHGQVISRYVGPYLTTASVQGAMTAVSAASKHVDEALRYIEYCNTNIPYRTMLRYGLEGVHYNYNADGTVTRTEQGSQNYNPLAYSQASYAVGPMEGEGSDNEMWQKVFESYEDAQVSNTIGFNFNDENVEMEVAACLAVWNNYASELRTGTSDPDVVLPKLISELETAGVRTVIEEAQAQLDAWVAENK